jgi:1,2-phenylacetyl-CoA epoxidase PaaB subunit
MADNKVTEAAWNLTRSIRETNQTIADHAIAAQERNLHFAQNAFVTGIELVRSQAEANSNLIRTLVEQPRRQQENAQAVANTALAAQEHAVKYAQNVYTNGIDVWNHQVESSRTLAQELVEQAKTQLDLWQTLAHESVNAYTQWLYSPISYYKQAVNYAEEMATVNQ